MDQDLFVDYYQVLECDRTATYLEIKRNYKRLLLLSHPDKVGGEKDEKFILIQRAWSVLKDPSRRKEYDATLTCHEHSECLLYETISLSDMDFESDEEIYSYPCRCGGIYLLSASQPITTNTVIGCDECSFSIQITC